MPKIGITVNHTGAAMVTIGFEPETLKAINRFLDLVQPLDTSALTAAARELEEASGKVQGDLDDQK